MLRNYKHPYLVEFIGAALAVERGADTVRKVRERDCFDAISPEILHGIIESCWLARSRRRAIDRNRLPYSPTSEFSGCLFHAVVSRDGMGHFLARCGYVEKQNIAREH